MAYTGDLDTGQSVYLDNQGTQTIVTIATRSAGQQQQASSSFQTGSWISPPQLFQTAQGAVLKIITAEREHFVQIQAGSLGVLNAAPSLSNAQQLQMQTVSSVPPSMPPMEPMQPMQPMSMKPMEPMQGEMQMSMKPMEMRMGNMEMRMGSSPASDAPATPRRFCNQCGAAVDSGDRFCSSCGQQLK